MKLTENVKYSNYISGFLAICLFIVLPSFLLIHSCPSPSPPSPAENAAKEKDTWILLHRGKGGDADVYYKKESIKKISDNIMEVYITWAENESNKAVQQVRIDCKNNKTAIGVCHIFIGDAEPKIMDFTKAGWIWHVPKNNVDRKLLKLVCKKK